MIAVGNTYQHFFGNSLIFENILWFIHFLPEIFTLPTAEPLPPVTPRSTSKQFFFLEYVLLARRIFII